LERKVVSGTLLALLLTSVLALTFNIQPVKASGTIYIRADGSIDPPDAPISTVDNVTYTLTGNISGVNGIVVERSNIIIDGAGYTLQGTGNGFHGFRLSCITNVTIRSTNIKNFFDGIWLDSSSNIAISGNNITNNRGSGIALSLSSNNSISGNSITANNRDGISLHYSSNNNSVAENNITANKWSGIGLDCSSNNTITGNNIIANTNYGISLQYSSYNSIFGNNIANNGHGISVWSGIGLLESSNNTFYHNNFIDNTNQVYDYSWDYPKFSSSVNVWDDGYPSGGNYWSDYTDADEKSGPDQDLLGNDGIWDHSYVMDSNNKDRYPLVNSWVPRTVGVQVGDWVKYVLLETTGYRPGFPVDLNDVEWGKTTVQAILGTTMEVELLFHLKNGTDLTMTGPVDVVTSGYPGPTFMSGLLISKGLPAGAPLYATYPFGATPTSLKINETIFKEYLGVSRETNHVNATKWEIHIDAYWDRATGVLCEYKEDFPTRWSWRFRIVDTNLWRAPVATASIDIAPDTLNLRSRGRWITGYIELPEGYDVGDIDVSSIMLNDTIPAELSLVAVGDYDIDGVSDLMVKFNGASVISYIIGAIGYPDGFATVTLTITGKLNNGIPFEGSDTAKIMMPRGLGRGIFPI